MSPARVILCALVLVVASDARSIRNLTEKEIEPKAKASEFFPDWVPFKNKRGEELGEFVQVPKSKLKKRLAPPVNFVLRAVAEPEGDEYFDKGQGESDNEEYYEKKDWSDAQRAPQRVELMQPAKPEQPSTSNNHTEISDIDGVVDIITKRPASPIVEAVHNFIKSNVDSKRKVEKKDSDEVETKDENNAEENESEEDKRVDTPTKSDDDTEYDETSSEKPKPDGKDQTESEAKKAEILSSVDELKERHAAEQRLISEKVKEEEMFKEERERENMQQSDEEDKYASKRKLNRIEPDYEEYDGANSSSDEKYQFNTQRMSTSTSTTATPPRRTTTHKGKNKTIETGKLSVFKNPHLYMLEDEEDSETVATVRPQPTHTESVLPALSAANDTTQRFSAKYRATPATPVELEESDEIERISLLPENDTNSEEPTLFFPKKTKKYKHRKTTSSSPATDSSAAESVPDGAAKPLSTSIQADATLGATSEHPGGAPADALPASTHHDKQQNKIEDYEIEKGRGRDYHSQHEEEHDEHGKKAYEVRNQKRRDKKLSSKSVATLKKKPWYLHYAVDGHHEDTKTAKGHHDKENHHGEYDDQGGVKEEHHDSAQHYGSHHHEEHGKKQAKYEESGKHAKGHSTKGSHDIHKKEEYEKKVEFFEEEGDSGEEEKHGGHHQDREHSEGGHYKKGDLEAGHHHHAKGDSGHFTKGGHQHGNKGHAQSGGHDGHGMQDHREHHKADRTSGNKWVYHHGHPAKTANLILVDRRTDKYSHGPYYYG